MFRKTLQEMMEDTGEKLIVDLRRKEDYRKETYPGAVNICYDDVYKYPHILPKDRRIYVFCYTGVTGDEIAEELSQKGYDIYSIEGGYHAVLRLNVRRIMGRER